MYQFTPRLTFVRILDKNCPAAMAWGTRKRAYSERSGTGKFYRTPLRRSPRRSGNIRTSQYFHAGFFRFLRYAYPPKRRLLRLFRKNRRSFQSFQHRPSGTCRRHGSLARKPGLCLDGLLRQTLYNRGYYRKIRHHSFPAG